MLRVTRFEGPGPSAPSSGSREHYSAEGRSIASHALCQGVGKSQPNSGNAST
jgi:hypothetical protein